MRESDLTDKKLPTFNTHKKEESLKLAFSMHNSDDAKERVKFLPDSEISRTDSFHSGTWCLTISYGIMLLSWFVGSIILTYYEIKMTDD
jgi:hypothetical protein